MTDERKERVMKAIDAYTKKITRTEVTARNALVREGIYDKKGKLTAEYSGRKSKKVPAA